VKALPEDHPAEQPVGPERADHSRDRGLAENEEASSAAEPASLPSERALRELELLVVLFVAFGSSTVWALADWYRGVVHFVYPEHRSVEQHVAYLLHYATSFAVLAYVLFRQRQGLRQLGLTADRRDVLPALVLTACGFVPSFVAYRFGHGSYWGVFVHPLASLAAGMTLSPLLLATLLIGAAHEELIVRAYLMTEVMALGGSTIFAVLASTGCQTLYHLYQGTEPALIAGCHFLIASIYYAYRRRALPVILSHFLYNVLSTGYRVYSG